MASYGVTLAALCIHIPPVRFLQHPNAMKFLDHTQQVDVNETVLPVCMYINQAACI